MLKILPIILSQTSQNFYPLFLLYSHNTTNYSFLFNCINDNITMQELLHIIYIIVKCFNKIVESSIRVSQSFCKLGGRHSKYYGKAWAVLGYATI